MSEQKADAQKPGDAHGGHYRLELVGLTGASDRPQIAMTALDAAGGTLYSQDIGDDGHFALPQDVLKRADRIVLGASNGKAVVSTEASLSFRAEEFMSQLRGNTLALAEGIWSRFRYHWVCVSGSVQACKRRPWWFDSIITAATSSLNRSSLRDETLSMTSASSSSLAQRITPSLNELIVWPVRCAPVCLGKVDVYRRTCCCWPIVFDDLRIDDLIRDLEIYVERLPKWPPPKKVFPPPPPPPPLGDPLRTVFFKGGAMNEMAIHAVTDLRMLRSLPRNEAASYISARPHLVHRLCSCSQPVKVGSGTIQPDGSFNICWLEPWRILLANCYEQYAYVVTQTIGASSHVIYNGLAADAWFAAGTHPTLRSYSSHAYTCGQTGTGDGDAYVFLDLIGDTESHELTTPSSTGWDRVAMPNATSGLLFPGVGPTRLRNLGGSLELTFNFSLGMRAASVDAKYYRVSISRADASGHPTGPRHYFKQGLAWDKVVGANIVPESLGPIPPASVGGELHLYRIPYGDEPWVGTVRYHALINTLEPELNVPPTLGVDEPGYAASLAQPAVNHLVTIEVFNSAGERIRPLGAPATGQPGTEVAKAFKFRRWFQAGGSVGDDTVEVPYGALTHLMCWDNRPPVADITRLVKGVSPSNEECQFLQGPGDTNFAIEYRAYVPDERFQHSHSVGWVRGLNASAANGGLGTLPTPLSPTNVGEPPSMAQVSGGNTFAQMLTRLDPPSPPTVLPRCSFAVTLTTYAKTTNGENMSFPYAQETAAFALAIGPTSP